MTTLSLDCPISQFRFHKIVKRCTLFEKFSYSVSSVLVLIGSFFSDMTWADAATMIGIVLGVTTVVINGYYQRIRTKAYVQALQEKGKGGDVPPEL